jgi:hypothetical protein
LVKGRGEEPSITISDRAIILNHALFPSNPVERMASTPSCEEAWSPENPNQSVMGSHFP